MTSLNRNNDDWTGADEKFQELLREMIREEGDIYAERTGRTDYSFLDLDENVSSVCTDEEYTKDDVKRQKVIISAANKKNKKEKKPLSPAVRIAVTFICVLLAGGGMTVWTNSEPANALKFHMEKKFHELKGGGFATEEEGEENASEDCITKKYKSMDDIDMAKKFMPDLPVPEYIPEGYELESLVIEKNFNDDYAVQYTFSLKNQRLCIGVTSAESDANSKMESKGELIQYEDREICLWNDSDTDSYGCSFLMGSKAFTILGEITQEEMLELAKNIK